MKQAKFSYYFVDIITEYRYLWPTSYFLENKRRKKKKKTLKIELENKTSWEFWGTSQWNGKRIYQERKVLENLKPTKSNNIELEQLALWECWAI